LHYNFKLPSLFFSEHQAIVNITNKAGVTPLHDAVIRGDVTIAKILLEHGATADIKAKEGCVECNNKLTAFYLQWALFFNVLYLLEYYYVQFLLMTVIMLHIHTTRT